MSSIPDKTETPMTAEKFRSVFRHDLRSHFSVLIGFGEVLREDFVSENHPSLFALDATLNSARMLLDDTITLINHCPLSSIAAFKSEVKAGLRKATLPHLRIINDGLNEIESAAGSHEILDNMLEAVRQLTLHCHAPFAERVELASTHLFNSTIQTTHNSSDNSLGRVIVIDDEPHNLRLISTFLQRLNLSVTTCSRGQDALTEIRQQTFDLILLDLHMPDMSGLEVLRKIKNQSESREIPVLIVTASDDVDELAECIEAGAVDSLTKPFQSAFLRARVLTSLGLHAAKKREQTFAEELQLQKNRIEELLGIILPREIIDELRETGKVQPRRHEHVCVFFCDIVNFTESCDTEDPVIILNQLQSLFSEFEAIADLHRLQKIKTIGDSFMAVVGLSGEELTPELQAVRAGFDMIDCAKNHKSGWSVRVGIHSGPVVSGLVGTKQFLFDIWGDTVNTAARIEGAGQPQKITASKQSFERLGAAVQGRSLGLVNLKGKGQQEIFIIDELRKFS
jgi:CheY-like chemotaxis protein